MKKITDMACWSFKNNRSFNQSNTRVSVSSEGTYMYLFGNLIAQKDNNGHVSVSLCGWNSNTTKERLRGLGVRISTKKGIPYLTVNGEEFPMELRGFYQI